MHELARRLRAESPGMDVTVIAADLAEPGSGAALTAELTARGTEVDVLINNAGFGSHKQLRWISRAKLSGSSSATGRRWST